jgi:beta-galactosidase GanA
MESAVRSIIAFAVWFAVAICAFPSSQTTAASHIDAFTYDNKTFLLHGESYQIRAGQMDPQRIHPAYWHDRLFKARALGLNTVFSYVFWDLIEPSRGSFDFTGRNDIASYFRQAQQVGLNVVLRPGSYACAERDWGGFPAWLLDVPNLEVCEPIMMILERVLKIL